MYLLITIYKYFIIFKTAEINGGYHFKLYDSKF